VGDGDSTDNAFVIQKLDGAPVGQTRYYQIGKAIEGYIRIQDAG
jgi:hypothetical protein